MNTKPKTVREALESMLTALDYYPHWKDTMPARLRQIGKEALAAEDRNASQIRATAEWGWTSYKRLPWAAKNGRRLYQAHFRSDAPLGFATCTIRFWARRPIIALRTIAGCKQDPMDFHEKVVN